MRYLLTFDCTDHLYSEKFINLGFEWFETKEEMNIFINRNRDDENFKIHDKIEIKELVVLE